MAMIRLRAAAASNTDTRLLLSRGWDDIIYPRARLLNGNGLTSCTR